MREFGDDELRINTVSEVAERVRRWTPPVRGLIAWQMHLYCGKPKEWWSSRKTWTVDDWILSAYKDIQKVGKRSEYGLIKQDIGNSYNLHLDVRP